MTAAAVPCPQRARLFRFLAYALVLASSGTQFAVVPVVPDYAQRLGLSGLQQGLVLGATGLACLAVSVPAGSLSDRLGARKLTLWAGALMAAAVLTQALAGSFLLLLAARLAFGTGYAVVWTAGLAWLERAAPGGLGLGGPVASAGIGSVAGPALSGFLVQYFGLASPFLAAAAVFALLTGALALLRMPPVAPAPSVRMRASLRAAVSDRRTLVAAAAIMTAGGTTGVSALLAPRQLHAAGASPGRIGLAFAAAGVIFVVASALTASTGRRAIQTRVLLAGMLALAVAFSPAALSQAPVAILGMLCATTAARAVLWTVSYPLAAAGAERSGAGLGVVMGLLNGVWAATVLLGPLLAGLGAELAGARVTFGLSAVACLTVLAAAIPAAAPLRMAGWGARGTLLARGLPGGRGVPGGRGGQRRLEPRHQNGNGTRPVPAAEAPPQPSGPHSVRLSGRHEDHRH